MNDKNVIVKKVTNFAWVNLFTTERVNSKGIKKHWIFASRNKEPGEKNGPSSVLIVPIVRSEEEDYIVLIEEYREPLFDCEWGFPAGLIDDGSDIEKTVTKELKEETGLDVVSMGYMSKPIYSSAGITDESCVIVFVEASGALSTKYQEEGEEITPHFLNYEDVVELLSSGKKIGGKSWGILYHYAAQGDFE